jgi:uncharacterized membrane protein YsdA (DUF1294 family)/cold shock CspA family protein
LIQWDAAKGYGFVVPDGGGAKLFAHITAFGPRAAPPQVGEALSFERGHDAQGKPRALKVRSVSVTPPPAVRPRGGGRPVWLVPAFAAAYLALHLVAPLPHFLWGVYMAMSLATFIVYFGDKRAARLGQPRVSEAMLHWLALAGGWPGALLAQQILRHKSGKKPFLARFWLTVAGNMALLLLLFALVLARRSAPTP